ncbi:MAG: S10 family peptidase [Fimbriimonadaceae bacterium]
MSEEKPIAALEKPKEEVYKIEPEAAPIVTKHEVVLDGKPLAYTVTTGMLALRSPLGAVEAGVFFMAYTVESEAARPLTFSFNGGPGSSSVWLHLGAVGPKRVVLQEDGMGPQPPYRLEDNQETWLRHTDIVFIDPVGTGFSRAVKKEDEKKYWGLDGDVDSIGDFIRTYLTKFNRWLSPLFIVGESYGTTRGAALSSKLLGHGIALSGITLVSSILNFQTARFVKGNDLPYFLFLPSYTSTAWYHKKLPADLQRKPLATVLSEVEAWAKREYWPALAEGSALSPTQQKRIQVRLARYTGLNPQYVDLSELRINIHRFCKELLRSEKRTVGRLDSRYKGIDGTHVTETPETDPSNAAIFPAYAATMNDYVRRVLGYETDLPYYIFNPGDLWKSWDWGSAGKGSPDTSEALREALSNNPYMRVFVASGYYDLATPYFATEYTLNHLGLDSSLRKNITSGYYEAGHMMYVHVDYLQKLRRDVDAFYASALA